MTGLESEQVIVALTYVKGSSKQSGNPVPILPARSTTKPSEEAATLPPPPDLTASPAKSLTAPPEPVVEAIDYVEGLEISAKLDALAKAAQNLNELSDRLTEYVSEIEGAVNKLNLGVRASVAVEVVAEDTFVNRNVFFDYKKAAARWGFFVNQYLDSDPENTWESWAFKDAPRELRLKAVEKIPLLLDELETKSVKLASDIADKISLARALVSALPQPRPVSSKK